MGAPRLMRMITQMESSGVAAQAGGDKESKDHDRTILLRKQTLGYNGEAARELGQCFAEGFSRDRAGRPRSCLQIQAPRSFLSCGASQNSRDRDAVTPTDA